MVRNITGKNYGRMVLYPGDFEKVDNPFVDLSRIKELVKKGKIVKKNLSTKEKSELANLFSKY